ncbi:MAG: GNAT family N-acetyltransferase [Paracoccaceae bacterium]|nr:GNAT family N-acetyltransferase [Paracoccaceae bacterium]
MISSLHTLYDVLHQTWPAAKHISQDGWCLRLGTGGGKRVCAATLEETFDSQSIDAAAQCMHDFGQPALFMVRDGEHDLDAALNGHGYEICDPCNIYAAPVGELTTQTPPRVSMFNIWEPLEIQKDIWRQGGIDVARLAIMERAKGPKVSILMRWDNHPAGSAFVAMSNKIAMVHVLEILPHQRRKGVEIWTMRQAALWAQKQGAHSISAICTKENTGANTLYSSLDMRLVGRYHYRIKKDKR